jgi:leucyl-tRNA synthetase
MAAYNNTKNAVKWSASQKYQFFPSALGKSVLSPKTIIHAGRTADGHWEIINARRIYRLRQSGRSGMLHNPIRFLGYTMTASYQPQLIEQEIQRYWEENNSFAAQEDFSREKFFCLAMIPYPSGHLHIGHVRNYTLADVIARYQHMQGKNVMQPIGWDAFGLPAENAALKNKTAPKAWTYSNIDHMRTQLKALGYAYDWSREITTCDPEYYRWEQWLFIQLFKKGLAYKKMSMVNWDPVDQTVLANEQVIDGKGWRSGAPVERREIAQWFLKITDYAEELLEGLNNLPGWPEQVKLMQKNWIGKSTGANIDFKVVDQTEKLTVFTTRPDTLMGVTYLTVASKHALAAIAAAKNNVLADFIKSLDIGATAEADIATQQKRGMDTGLVAIHPITGEKLPIWIANYVLNNVGTGAVMAVPAHDERDFEFAQIYHLPIKVVIVGESQGDQPAAPTSANTESGILINSDIFDGLESEQAKITVINHLEKNKCGEKQTRYRLHDWGISRQRYWGAPIPIIHCEKCGPVAVPAEDLPVRLPENVDFSQGIVTLSNMPEFYKTICPQCKACAKRETDTFDTFMESSWYYARMACPDQHNSILDDRAKYWTPVDQYVGGIEHAVMHLLYARFIHKVLRDSGFVNSHEPFERLLTQGMVLKDGAKMSKSKGNTVDPNQLLQRYGADSVRVFVTFTAPPEQSLEWSDSGFEGCFRFLKRVWTFSHERAGLFDQTDGIHEGLSKNSLEKATEEQKDIWREINLILKQAQCDYDRLQLNTVVSGCMKLFNLLVKIPFEGQEDSATLCVNEQYVNLLLICSGTKILLSILSPIAPHICHKLWTVLKLGEDIDAARWPKVSAAALISKSIAIVVQINGKLRAKLNVPSNATEEEIKTTTLTDSHVSQLILGKTVKKVIIVPNRLINIVVADD